LIHDNEIMDEQLLRVELQQTEKKESGSQLDRNWIKANEKCLMKCFLIHDCITLLVAMPADPY
jgi:hypothetical protein